MADAVTQGTAKTTTVEMLRELVDPAVVPHEHTYRDVRDMYIECVASWVIAMDNLSSLPDWLSDTICRLATGGGFKTRKLWTDRDQEVFKGKRPVIMNGISDVASKADLLDRSLLVDLPVIPAADRKYLEELKADFHEHQPSILGALFDAMAAGLHGVEGVDLSGRLPRMADFARWVVATETALGMEEGTFMEAYAGSRSNATETALEAEPIWRVLYELAKEHDDEDRWVGNMKELLAELNAMELDNTLKHSKDWPKTERKLSDIIKRLGPALLELGIHVERVSKSKREGRRYYLYYHEPPNEEE
jgi:putative DNA primase/helicase